MRIFRIKATGDRDAFYKIFIILNNTINIRLSALKVFADLVYFNYKYRDLPSVDRNELVFSYETRRFIMEKLGLTTSDLNNQVSFLRKMGLVKGHSIKKEYQINLDDYTDILFTIER